MAEPQPIPITIIAGFLGAGKTTLLNRLLTAKHGRRLAVLVNDFGDVNIDAFILDTAGTDGVVDLPNGCVCCTLARDLVRVVQELIDRDEPPEHLILEASGVSAPADIEAILDVPQLAGRVRVDGIVTLVDTQNILRLARAVTFADKQVAAADLLLLNKIDLVSEEELAAVLAWVRGIAPEARVIETHFAQLPLGLILGATPVLRVERSARETVGLIAGDEGHGLTTWTFRAKRPLSQECLEAAISALPAAVYRAKGIVHLAHDPVRRYILQAVGQRVAISPDREWGISERETQLVFIGAGHTLDPHDVDGRLSDCVSSSA